MMSRRILVVSLVLAAAALTAGAIYLFQAHRTGEIIKRLNGPTSVVVSDVKVEDVRMNEKSYVQGHRKLVLVSPQITADATPPGAYRVALQQVDLSGYVTRIREEQSKAPVPFAAIIEGRSKVLIGELDGNGLIDGIRQDTVTMIEVK